jgi:hypothetical protein
MERWLSGRKQSRCYVGIDPAAATAENLIIMERWLSG